MRKNCRCHVQSVCSCMYIRTYNIVCAATCTSCMQPHVHRVCNHMYIVCATTCTLGMQSTSFFFIILLPDCVLVIGAGSNVVSVAEHVLMMILSLVRNYIPAYTQVSTCPPLLTSLSL
jgi:hypothetical protein